MATADGTDDIAALAKGGRTNIAGFILRLVARLPFLSPAASMAPISSADLQCWWWSSNSPPCFPRSG
jgi:hypothetical protein